MLNRLSVIFYNHYRTYKRHRVERDLVALVAQRGHLPAALGSRGNVLRDKTIRALTAATLAVGIFAAGGAYEHHQEYAAHQAALEQQWIQNEARVVALDDAYGAAYEAELKARHLQRPHDGGLIADIGFAISHPPRDPSTLAVGDALKKAESRADQISSKIDH